jgi:acetolactate synthase regulatory subunit
MTAATDTQQPKVTRRRRSQQPAAIRMARLRDRRRRGFRVYQIEVSAADLDALSAYDLLDRLARNNPVAVERAIGMVLDRLGG